MLLLAQLAVSEIVFANQQNKNEPFKNSVQKPLSAAETKSERKRRETTLGGIRYKKWQAFLAGQKVPASAAKRKKPTQAFTHIEAIIISLSLPPGSCLGFGLMVRIHGSVVYGLQRSVVVPPCDSTSNFSAYIHVQ